MTQIKFGTDGWRALMGKDFTTANVERVAQSFSLYVNESIKPRTKNPKPIVAVGYDFRDHSKEFAEAFATVLLSNNIDVILSDRPVPTPAVSRAVIHSGYDAGIVITASHNPGGYNGIKIKDAQGSSADLSITRRVENLIDKVPVNKSAKGQIPQHNFLDIYLDSVKQYIQMGLFNNKPLNVLVDSMHGVGSHHIEDMLKGTAVKITTLRGERDSKFGGVAPEPILKNMSQTADKMKNGAYDIALVTDGDADRIGAVRPGGEFVSPGTILSLIMLHLCQDLGKKGSVVTTVSNTSLIYRVARKLGLTIHETPVGFKYICEIMRKENVLIAGEESGGLAFQDYMLERDGLLSGLLLIQMMEYRKQTLSQILADIEKEVGKFYYIRQDMKYPDPLKPKLIQYLKNFNDKKIEGIRITKKRTDDGVKFTFENDAWLLFRLSGTEPLLRVYAESADITEAKKLAAWGKKTSESIQ